MLSLSQRTNRKPASRLVLSSQECVDNSCSFVKTNLCTPAITNVQSLIAVLNIVEQK